MAICGSIVAGEYDRVLIIGEKVTAAGERTLVVRTGGTDMDGARDLAANALWSMKEKQ